jgi:hypothetical protein
MLSANFEKMVHLNRLTNYIIKEKGELENASNKGFWEK